MSLKCLKRICFADKMKAPLRAATGQLNTSHKTPSCNVLQIQIQMQIQKQIQILDFNGFFLSGKGGYPLPPLTDSPLPKS